MSQGTQFDRRWNYFLNMVNTRGCVGNYSSEAGKRSFTLLPGWEIPEGLNSASLLNYEPLTRASRKEILKKAHEIASKMSEEQKMQIINSK